MVLRICRVCKDEKENDEFVKSDSHLCKLCRAKQRRKKDNPLSVKEKQELIKVNQSWCNRCKSIKDLEEFSPHNTNLSGYRYSCKSCEAKRERKWNLESKYGISLEDYENLLAKQNHSCAICETSLPKGKHNVFKIDHCHNTGKVRGLLCNNCNTALGLLKDDIKVLSNAINYLLKK